MKLFQLAAIAATAIGLGSAAFAGPVIINGTDSADHGAGTLAGNSGIQATNTDGWE